MAFPYNSQVRLRFLPPNLVEHVDGSNPNLSKSFAKIHRMTEGAPCRSLRRRRCSWFQIRRHVRSVRKCAEMQKGKYPVKFRISNYKSKINNNQPRLTSSQRFQGQRQSRYWYPLQSCTLTVKKWQMRKISQIKRWKPTPLTTPNILSKARNVACQNVKKTKNSQRINKYLLGWENAPTAFTAKSFNNGRWTASSFATGTYSWIKQYIAIVTETDITIVIYSDVEYKY